MGPETVLGALHWQTGSKYFVIKGVPFTSEEQVGGRVIQWWARVPQHVRNPGDKHINHCKEFKFVIPLLRAQHDFIPQKDPSY